MKAKRFLLCLPALLLLSGCASQGGLFGPAAFEITHPDNRFNPDGNVVITSKNNRVSSTSIAGGIYIGGDGVYINPAVTRSAEGDLILLALNVINFTSSGTAWGSPNSLGLLRTVSFLINGQELVHLAISQSDYQWLGPVRYNAASGSASADIAESGIAALSVEQYKRILGADTLTVKIVGTKRSVTYEPSDVSDSFQPNLKQFYRQVLQGKSTL